MKILDKFMKPDSAFLIVYMQTFPNDAGNRS